MAQLTPYREHALAEVDPTIQASGETHDLLRTFAAVRKRWRLLVAIVAGFIFLVGIATLIAPKSYTTTVRLMSGRPSSPLAPKNNDETTALPILNALVLQNGEQSAETFAQLAQQRGLAQHVIDTLKLDTKPDQLLLRVAVKPIVNTSLLNLSVRWGNRDQSAEIANTFAQAYVDQERDFVRSEAVAAIGYLSNELPEAQLNMRQTAQRLADFQAKHGYIDAAAREQDINTRIATIEQKIDQLSVDQSEASALLKNVNGQLRTVSSTVDNAREVATNPVSGALESKLADVETQLRNAEEQYTPEHPDVIALKQQRAALLAQIRTQPSSLVDKDTTAPNPVYQALQQQAATYAARISGDQAQLKTLKTQHDLYSPTASKLPSQGIEFDSINNEAKRAANVYNALAQKYSDALVAKSTAISDILIIQPASAESAIVSPNLAINLAVAAVVGLLLALGTLYVLEMMERRAADEDFARMLGLPVVARIPAFNTTNQRMLPWIQSMTVEAFLHLCITLRLNTSRSLRTLAILSPCRGDGKSTVAYNLAKSMATLQPRVLLVDADMRRPTLHEKAHCENGPGLSDVLNGTAELGESVREVAPGLDLLTAGAKGANPVVLLESYFADMLALARERYSMVIVDAPAFAAVTDGLQIASRVDGSLLIVVGDSTDEKEARNTVAQMSLLGINNVLGIVVNKQPPRVHDYADYFSQGRELVSGPA
jgi:capsular exopolysaccharide synthesis family protein